MDDPRTHSSREPGRRVGVRQGDSRGVGLLKTSSAMPEAYATLL